MFLPVAYCACQSPVFLVFVILHGVSGVAFEFLSQDVYIAVEIL